MNNSNEMPQDQVDKHQEVLLHACFQRDLALRYFHKYGQENSKEEIDECLLKWVMFNKHEFSAGYRRVLSEHPELVGLYRSNPSAALEQMERWLYQENHIDLSQHAEAA